MVRMTVLMLSRNYEGEREDQEKSSSRGGNGAVHPRNLEKGGEMKEEIRIQRIRRRERIYNKPGEEA